MPNPSTDERREHIALSGGLIAAAFAVIIGVLSSFSQMAPTLNHFGLIMAGTAFLALLLLVLSIYFGGNGIATWANRNLDSERLKDDGNFNRQAICGILGLVIASVATGLTIIWGVDRNQNTNNLASSYEQQLSMVGNKLNHLMTDNVELKIQLTNLETQSNGLIVRLDKLEKHVELLETRTSHGAAKKHNTQNNGTQNLVPSTSPFPQGSTDCK